MVRHGTKICQRPGNVRGESKEESQEFMKKLHTYIGHYWYGYLFAICSMIIATGLDMVYPQITQRIVDEVIIGGNCSPGFWWESLRLGSDAASLDTAKSFRLTS